MSYAVGCGWTMNLSIPANLVNKKQKNTAENTYSVSAQRINLMAE